MSRLEVDKELDLNSLASNYLPTNCPDLGVCSSGQCMDHACILKCSGSVSFWAVYGPCMHTKVQWECVLLGSVWTCMHTKVQWECVLLGIVWTMHAY